MKIQVAPKSTVSLQEFSEKTTVHGLPKILSNESGVSKCVWLVLFSGATALFLIQSMSLLTEYFNYPTRSVVETKRIKEFPSVTMCNIRHIDPLLNLVLAKSLNGKLPKNCDPYGNEDKDDKYLCYLKRKYGKQLKLFNYISKPGKNVLRLINKYPEYKRIWFKLVEDMDKRQREDVYNRRDNREFMASEISNAFSSRVTFAANVIKSNLDPVDFGFEFDHFVIKCRYGSFECAVPVEEKCNGQTENETLCYKRNQRGFVRLYDTNQYNCYTFNPSDFLMAAFSKTSEQDLPSPMTGAQAGLDVVLLADGMYLSQDNDTNPDGIGMQESIYGHSLTSGVGVRVIIHPAKASPIPYAQGWDIPAGRMTTISVRANMYKKAHPPYGPECATDCPFSDGFVGKRYNYLKCLQDCMMIVIQNRCNCTDMKFTDFFIRPTNFSDKQLPFCQEFDDQLFNEDGSDKLDQTKSWVKKMKCAIDTGTMIEQFGFCPELYVCPCLPPCEENSDRTEVSSVDWPVPTSVPGDETYFNARIRNEDVRYLLRTISPESNPQSMRNRFKQLTRINIHLADPNIQITEDRPKMAAADLASSLGGALGLWMGVSVLSVCEIIELALKLSGRCNKNKVKSMRIDVAEAQPEKVKF